MKTKETKSNTIDGVIALVKLYHWKYKLNIEGQYDNTINNNNEQQQCQQQQNRSNSNDNNNNNKATTDSSDSINITV